MITFLKKYLASIETKTTKNINIPAIIHALNFRITLFYKYYKKYEVYHQCVYSKDIFKRKLKIEIRIHHPNPFKTNYNYFCFNKSFRQLKIINKYFFKDYNPNDSIF